MALSKPFISFNKKHDLNRSCSYHIPIPKMLNLIPFRLVQDSADLWVCEDLVYLV